MGKEREIERAIVREKGWGSKNKKSNSEGKEREIVREKCSREREIEREMVREEGVGKEK